MDKDEILMSPARKERIHESVKRTEDAVQAVEAGRRALSETPKLLEQVRQQATGVFATDLLADRSGRPSQHRSRK